ncbi:MAG: YlbF family regulator [Oscillospiraceae bacterium]|nr:YlbF family regulator [Oscillospiraceae bacterium]
MSVIEKARELGKALQEDEIYSRYKAAKLANDKDESLQKNIVEFNSTKMELNIEMAKDDKDTDAITRLNSKLNSIYKEVTENPNMVAFEAARSEMDDILESIHYIITCAANGDDPMTCPDSPPASECSGSCATCGGCG